MRSSAVTWGTQTISEPLKQTGLVVTGLFFHKASAVEWRLAPRKPSKIWIWLMWKGEFEDSFGTEIPPTLTRWRGCFFPPNQTTQCCPSVKFLVWGCDGFQDSMQATEVWQVWCITQQRQCPGKRFFLTYFGTPQGGPKTQGTPVTMSLRNSFSNRCCQITLYMT